MKRFSFFVSFGFAAGLAPLFLSSAQAQETRMIYYSANDVVYSFTPPGPAILVARLFTNPEGLAFDTSGNLFVAGGGDVSKITPGGTVTRFATLPGFGGYGMVIDAQNILYVAGAASLEIKKITPDGTVSTYATLDSGSTGITIDSDGNLYKVGGGNTVKRIPAGGGAASDYATLDGNNLYGLAFDAFGYLYASDVTKTTIYKIPPGGGSYVNFGTLPAGVKGLTFDSNGNLYGAQFQGDQIYRITPEGTVTTYGSNLGGPRYLTFKPGFPVAARAAGFVTAIPGGTGNFTAFGRASLSGSHVGFYGGGSSGQQGIYGSDVSAVGSPYRVADTATAIPGGSGNFTSFIPSDPIAPAVDGTRIAFFGAGGDGQQGLYVSDSAIPGNPVKIANTATVIPGGTGNFTAFPGGPSISGNNAVFAANGSSGQQGIYGADISAVGPPFRIADTGTAIPGGSGNFTAFPGGPSISGNNAVFAANGSSGQQGIYGSDVSAIGSPYRVADTTTAIPSGSGRFTSFIPGEPIAPAIDGTRIAFFGAGGDGQQGLYVSDSAIPGNPVKIANSATIIPGGTGNFTSFGDVSISATDVAFLGYGSGGQQGIYALTGTALVKVVDLTDILDGRAITSLKFAATGLSGDPVAFQATFADNSQGIYTAKIVPPFTLRITALERSGTDLRLSFTTQAGANYAIQSRADLTSAAWATLPGTTNSGTGGTVQQTLTIALAEPQQFYRVQQQP